MIYRDGARGSTMMKRFAVTGVTRDKEYPITKGTKGSKVLYFTANPNGESEILTIHLRPRPKLKILQFDINFADLTIKGRDSQGNILTKEDVRKIILKEKGLSTLGARKIWFDDTVQRLNAEGRGQFLGDFAADDKILTIMQSGHYRLYSFDLSTHFDEDLVLIEKFNPSKVISAIYYDSPSKTYFVKRFLIEPTDKKTCFISEEEGSYLEIVTNDKFPVVELKFGKEKNKEIPDAQIRLADFIGVKGMKAKGNKLSNYKVKEINMLPPLPVVEGEIEEIREIGGIEEIKEVEGIKDVVSEPVTLNPKPETPHKEVAFEITNPESVNLEEPKEEKPAKPTGKPTQIKLDFD